MRRLGILLLALVVTVPGLAAPQAAAQGPSGEHPAEVKALMADLLENAEVDVRPDRPLGPHAQASLESAREALEDGEIALAVDRYISFRVSHVHEQLVDELSSVSDNKGRVILINVSERYVTEGEATSQSARSLVNGLDPGNLSVRGAETGLWGAYLLGQGEFLLSLHSSRQLSGVYEGGELDAGQLRTLLHLGVGGATRVAVGAALVGVAPHVPGPEVAADELETRLERVAAQTAYVQGSPPSIEHLPRANRTQDSPLLRAGLTMTAQRELEGQEARRLLLTNPTGSPGQFLAEGLASDRENLERWTAVGSPLALAAYQEVDVEVPQDPSRRQIADLANVRAFAQAVLSAERIISPETPELEEEEEQAPVPWIPVVAVALVGAALVRARRRG